MSICTCLLIAVLAQLSAVDPGIRTDDFISLSCTEQGACLFLDEVGELYFSADRGRSLHARSVLTDLGLRKIAFSGLVSGFALDQAGRLWISSNGGKTFEVCRHCNGLPGLERFSALTTGPHGRIWLGSTTGKVFAGQRELPAGGVTFELVHDTGGRRLTQILPLADRGLLALDEDGLVTTKMSAETDWRRVRPLEGRTIKLIQAKGGQTILAGGCKGALSLSTDGGRNWKKLEWEGDKLAGACLRPLGPLAGSRMLVAGPAGRWLVVDAEEASVKLVASQPQLRIQAGQAVAGGLVLAGQGGARGLVRIMPDGSLSFDWQQVIPPATTDMCLFGKAGVIRLRADGNVDASNDSGESWSTFQSPSARTNKVDFVDKLHGFAIVDRHELHGTNDGGKTWRQLGRWSDLALFDLSFADVRTGWLVGESGAVLRTVDGGRNWTLDKLPADNRDLNRVHFVDRKHGWAVGGHQIVFRTRDGGKKWERLLHGRGNLYALFFLDEKTGWVTGDDGMVLSTIDGGDSWEKRPTGTTEPLRAIAFSDPYRGLAGGGLGLLFATRDGGRVWKRIDTHTRAAITAIGCYRKSGLCLVSGERGLFLVGNPFR